MEFKLNAISLRSVDYGENGKLVTLLTSERGKLTAKANGCKSLKSKLRLAASPFCYGEYILKDKEGRLTVADCNVAQVFGDFGDSLEKFYFSAVIVEAAEKFSLEEQTDEPLFELTLGALKELSDTDSPAVTALRYLLEVLDAEGYGFTVNYDKEPYLDIDAGGFVEKSKKSVNSVALSPKTADFLRRLVIGSPFETPDKATIKESYTVIGRYVFYECGHSLYTVKNVLALD